MKLCNACRRHVRPAEGACPFCGEVLRAAPAARVGMVVLLGTLGSSCTSRPVEDSATGGGTTASSSGTDTGSGTDGSSTVSPTSTSTASTSATTGNNSTTGVDTTGVQPSTGQQSSVTDPDTGDEGCAFYGGGCFDFSDGNKECDQWIQDCPRGEKCTPYSSDGDTSWDSLKCVPVVDSPGQLGDTCTSEGIASGLDSCDHGLLCWDVDKDTNEGTCIGLCIGPPDEPMCAAPGTACVISNDVLSICVPACDPILQDCPDDDLCIPNPQNSGQFVCILDASGEGGQEFDACEFANACDAGFFCLGSELAVECDPMALGCCAAVCDTMNPACAGQNQECLPWFEMGMAPPGLENVGVCGLPG